ncbi:hypothetical protein B0H19DRAFT_1275793 [Mycena capillaripes]|nr:hypothetical protein B0H19DRAFT_1275793 [Mycena capillaripes]
MEPPSWAHYFKAVAIATSTWAASASPNFSAGLLAQGTPAQRILLMMPPLGQTPLNAPPSTTVDDLFTLYANHTPVDTAQNTTDRANFGATSTLLLTVHATECPDVAASGAGGRTRLDDVLAEGTTTDLPSFDHSKWNDATRRRPAEGRAHANR